MVWAIGYLLSHVKSVVWTILSYHRGKCNELYMLYNADVGITTGMAYAAAEQYCHTTTEETVVIIAADGREMYHDYL
jgi:cysteine synthase